ncbi:hypothetical protein JL721_5230 [Aureococcus anophagefferens]|nr:hypothetical protein JL721_5230 [Aureococcus anophagefferens]
MLTRGECDRDEAIRWLESAAAVGNEDAIDALARIKSGEINDPRRVFAWIRTSANAATRPRPGPASTTSARTTTRPRLAESRAKASSALAADRRDSHGGRRRRRRRPAEVLSAAGGGAGNTPPPIVCPGHTRPLAEVAFSPHTPDGYFLISGCLDGSPMLRDASSGDWIGTFAGHKGAVWSAQLCSEARLAATGSGDFSAKVWDAVTGACLATLEHKHIVKSVDFRGDRACLATGGHEGLARVYDVERGLGAAPLASFSTKAGDGGGRPAAINKVCWTPGGAPLLVCGAADGRVLAFDARVAAPVATLECRSKAGVLENVMDLELTDGKLGPTLTVAAGDRVHLFDAADWGRVRRAPIDCPVHFREEGGASLRPDGRELVLGGGRHGGSRQGALGVEKGATNVGDIGSDLTVFSVDVDSGAITHERKGHCGPVRCLRYHPDGTRFATGSEDGTIRLWVAAPGAD